MNQGTFERRWFQKPKLFLGIGVFLAAVAVPVLMHLQDRRGKIDRAIKEAALLAGAIEQQHRSFQFFNASTPVLRREWIRHENPQFFVDCVGTWRSIPSDTPLRTPITLADGSTIQVFGEVRDLRNQFGGIFNAIDSASIAWNKELMEEDVFVGLMGPILTKDDFLKLFRDTLRISLEDGRTVAFYAPHAEEFADEIIAETDERFATPK